MSQLAKKKNFSIKELILDGADFTKYSVEGSEKSLPKLSKINIFVGPNNPGKSRFLRNLASIKEIRFIPNYAIEAFEAIRKKLVENIRAVADGYSIVDAGGFVAQSESLQEITSVKEREQYKQPLASLVTKILQQNVNGFTISSRGMGVMRPAHVVLQKMKDVTNEATEGLEPALRDLPEQFEFKRVYLPTLRGLRPVGAGDSYVERTKKDYFSSGAENLQIFTGLSLYNDFMKLLLGTLEEREKAADFQKFLSESFFEGQPVALIPKHGSDVLDVKIGEEAQRPIFSLGDGIQSIITTTFPLFENREKDLLVFIEEPEMFMHPGMQRLFLNVLMTFPRAQYFLATHSNHLLDLTLDIDNVSVFTFRKALEPPSGRERDAHITIENVSNEDERSLQLLGIQNSSVFLSNCTIWVEGITDRRYISHYLNLYQEHLRKDAESNSLQTPRRYRQDLHYSFVEYAGANITHFSFLETETDPIVVERLCAKLLLITDKDNETKRSKAERHKALSEKLGDRYICLEPREIENLLTSEVISAVVKSYEGADTELSTFDQSDYRQKPLGQFIEEKVLSAGKKRAASYQTKSGTISDKITFCQKALENINQFEDLSPEAQTLTKKVYEFIQSMNP
jgi:AAA domain, putative AbiEii toxin, Type IV TA system